MKFKYNHQNNTLAYQKPLPTELWYQIAEEQQFLGNFAAQGFNLTNGWITFQVYQKQIKVFYKQIESDNLTDFWEPQAIIYYRQYLAKQEEIIFEFSTQDEVEKIANKWVKKRKELNT